MMMRSTFTVTATNTLEPRARVERNCRLRRNPDSHLPVGNSDLRTGTRRAGLGASDDIAVRAIREAGGELHRERSRQRLIHTVCRRRVPHRSRPRSPIVVDRHKALTLASKRDLVRITIRPVIECCVPDRSTELRHRSDACPAVLAPPPVGTIG
jgi:hypothetical protein